MGPIFVKGQVFLDVMPFRLVNCRGRFYKKVVPAAYESNAPRTPTHMQPDKYDEDNGRILLSSSYRIPQHRRITIW